MAQSAPLGVPIPELLREHEFGIDDRLQIVTTVCDAVERAHQSGRIHGSIHPALIGLSLDGQEVVADLAGFDDPFGELPFSEWAEYRSPEQLRDPWEPADTRADVYSLGVILYELISGVLPYDVRGLDFDDAAQVIRSEPPRALTESAPDTPPSLAAIVEKAIASRRDRYGSVSQLADDIRRYERREPLSVVPFNASTEIRSLFDRHRAAALSGAAAAACLVAACGYLAYETYQTRVERNTADALHHRASAENEFLRDMLLSTETGSGASDPTLGHVLTGASRRLETQLADRPRVRSGVRLSIGEAQRALRHWEDARTNLLASLETRREIYGERSAPAAEALAALVRLESDPANPDRDFDRAASLAADALSINIRRLGLGADATLTARQIAADVALARGDAIAAERGYREALRGRVDRDEAQREVAGDLWLSLSKAVLSRDRISEARTMGAQALDIYRDEVGPIHAKSGSALSQLGRVAVRDGDHATAESLYVAAAEIPRRLYGDDAPAYADALRDVGEIQLARGSTAAAEATYRRVLGIDAAAYGTDARHVARDRYDLALVLQRRGAYEEADALAEKVFDVWSRELGSAHPDVGAALGLRATLALQRGRWEESEDLHRKALEFSREHYGEYAPRTLTAHVRMAEYLLESGRADEAATYLGRARRLADAAQVNDASLGIDLLRAEGRLNLVRGNPAEAEGAFRSALRVQSTGADVGAGWNLRVDLGHALHDQGRLEEAESELSSVVVAMEAQKSPDDPGLARARARYADLLVSRGRKTDACELFRLAEPVISRTYPADHPWIDWVRVSRILCDESWTRGQEGVLFEQASLLAMTHLSITEGERTRIVTRAMWGCEEIGARGRAAQLRDMIP